MLMICTETKAEDFLYPPLEPYSSGYLHVDDIHTLYWEQSGNPDGAPIVFLHGGPGAGASPINRQFFDPEHYRIIIFDQRGAGRSTPLAETRNNTTDLLVQDIETLRKHLNIEQWHIFGGSWGSTLALRYAIAHADRCLSLILRGIFLCEEEEIQWFLYSMRTIFPEAWERFTSLLNENDKNDILKCYYRLLTDKNESITLEAATYWAQYESACATLYPRPPKPFDEDRKRGALALARLEAHYFIYEKAEPENSILKYIDNIRHIPTTIIQGRYDIICPIKSAYRLHQAWPQSELNIVPYGGHSALDPAICKALIEATDKFKQLAA